MRSLRFPAACALLAVASLAAPRALAADRFDPSRSDPKAVALADQVIAALGGEKAWNDLRYLSWTFEVYLNDTLRSSRRHCWDKRTGWHRVDGTTRAGLPFCLMDNLNTREGRAWMGGNPIEGDSLKKLTERAYALWVNDLYWVAMPFKLKDPGVILALDGERKEGDQAWDKLSLAFDQVGLTPGDHYWLFVNRATHRIDRWEMVLQGDKPPASGESPAGYDWSGWQQAGGCWFSTARTRKDPASGSVTRLSFAVSAPASLPETAFTSNAPVQ